MWQQKYQTQELSLGVFTWKHHHKYIYRYIVGTFRVHLGYISWTFRTHFRYISGTFRIHFGNFSGTSQEHLRDSLDTFQVHFRYISNTSQGLLGYILGTFSGHPRYVSGTFRCTSGHDRVHSRRQCNESRRNLQSSKRRHSFFGIHISQSSTVQWILCMCATFKCTKMFHTVHERRDDAYLNVSRSREPSKHKHTPVDVVHWEGLRKDQKTELHKEVMILQHSSPPKIYSRQPKRARKPGVSPWQERLWFNPGNWVWKWYLNNIWSRTEARNRHDDVKKAHP